MSARIMPRTFVLLTLICCTAVFSGCYSINYVTRAPAEEGTTRRMHHHFLAGLVEVGAPVRFDARCPAGISRVKTSVSALHGFTGALANAPVGYAVDYGVKKGTESLSSGARVGITAGYQVLSAVVMPIWSPTTIDITCARPRRDRVADAQASGATR